MMLPLHDRLRTAVRAALADRFGLDAAAIGVPLEIPPNRALGDLGSPVAFELARTLRKAPRVIAQELAGATRRRSTGVQRVDAAPTATSTSFSIARRSCAGTSAPAPPQRRRAGRQDDRRAHRHQPEQGGAHRPPAQRRLGDTLVRALRFRGTPVEVQNYIDDTGVQVADVVVGFRDLEGLDLDGVRRIADTTRFDYYCWDLYARVTEWYEADKARLAIRAATLHDIEHGDDPTADDRRVHRRAHRPLPTWRRWRGSNIDYDLLTWEGDILRLQFWAHAFERAARRRARSSCRPRASWPAAG